MLEQGQTPESAMDKPDQPAVSKELPDRRTTAELRVAHAHSEELETPVVQASQFNRLVYHTDPTSPASERFRLLRMRLRHLWAAGQLRSLLVTSPLPQDGKTTVALNLASALCEQGAKRVLLVDADLHRRSVNEHLGLDPVEGLAECLQDGLNPYSAVRRVEPLGWYLLSAGNRELENPSEIIRPQDVDAVVRGLWSHFDWVIVDSPPVLPLTDALSLAQAVDGVLLVARAGQTPTKAVEDTLGLLGRKRLIGMVLNGIEKSNHPYSKYENYYRNSKSSSNSTESSR